MKSAIADVLRACGVRENGGQNNKNGFLCCTGRSESHSHAVEAGRSQCQNVWPAIVQAPRRLRAASATPSTTSFASHALPPRFSFILLNPTQVLSGRLEHSMPGFDFSNHNRNLALHAQGVPLPKATSTGTTIVGCLYDGGVVIAADTRATSGPIVADKVIFIHFVH